MKRYAYQISESMIDAETFKTFILMDLKRIFQGDDIVRLNNSIALYKERLAKQDDRIKEVVDENFQLRVNVNKMLAERETTAH